MNTLFFIVAAYASGMIDVHMPHTHFKSMSLAVVEAFTHLIIKYLKNVLVAIG